MGYRWEKEVREERPRRSPFSSDIVTLSITTCYLRHLASIAVEGTNFRQNAYLHNERCCVIDPVALFVALGVQTGNVVNNTEEYTITLGMEQNWIRISKIRAGTMWLNNVLASEVQEKLGVLAGHTLEWVANSRLATFVIQGQITTTTPIRMTFSPEAMAFLEAGESIVPFIYSTRTYSPVPWGGGFDSTMDLTFGKDHSVYSEARFNEIRNAIEGRTSAEIETLIDEIFSRDLARFENHVNNFLINHNIFFTQHQFDATVAFVFNTGEAALMPNQSSVLGHYLSTTKHEGNINPSFNRDAIVEGFTWTRINHVRVAGLVTRRNNELNLFFNADYIYHSRETLVARGLAFIDYP